MTSQIVSYHFEGEGIRGCAFEVAVDRPMRPREGRASWTDLTYKQCKNCSLREDIFKSCPAAVDIEMVVESFETLLEKEDVHTIVSLPDGREVHKSGPASEALSELLVLILASSACPIFSRLKGLALTHVPFSTLEQSMMRWVGSYLISQLIQSERGEEVNWSLDGLKHFLDELDLLNESLLQRLESASRQSHAVESIRILVQQVGGLRDVIDSWTDQLEIYSLPVLPEP